MSSNTDATPEVVIETGKTMIGRVKWFNSKNGYGFITIKDTNNNDCDIFVHHNSINVSNEQYKYLVMGEYVFLKVMETNNNKHKYYADEVCGVNGGLLMCETRRELKDTKTKYKSNEDKKPNRYEGGNEEVKENDRSWSYVVRGKKTNRVKPLVAKK